MDPKRAVWSKEALWQFIDQKREENTRLSESLTRIWRENCELRDLLDKVLEDTHTIETHDLIINALEPKELP